MFCCRCVIYVKWWASIRQSFSLERERSLALFLRLSLVKVGSLSLASIHIWSEWEPKCTKQSDNQWCAAGWSTARSYAYMHEICSTSELWKRVKETRRAFCKGLFFYRNLLCELNHHVWRFLSAREYRKCFAGVNCSVKRFIFYILTSVAVL